MGEGVLGQSVTDRKQVLMKEEERSLEAAHRRSRQTKEGCPPKWREGWQGGTQEWSLDAGRDCLSAEDAETCALVVQPSWSAFIVSTCVCFLGVICPAVERIGYTPGCVLGVPSLDGCVLKL
jgi:hypothetical protein